MQVFAKAPCRVDLAGGTLDIWPLYLHHQPALTVNFAITIETSCRVTARPDASIILRSADQRTLDSYPNLEALVQSPRHHHPLAAWVVKYFRPVGGLELDTHSGSPQGAGIAGSSSMFISTVSALNRYCKTGYGPEKLREIAQNIEAQVIRVPTGCQDYYPALYGGLSAVHLTEAGIRREEVAVDAAELNSRFVLVYTGKPRKSGINNWEVTKLHIDGDRQVWKNFARIAAISHAMRGALARADWAETARLLGEEWLHRRKNVPGITTDTIDHLMKAAKRSGARAAKVCGAGGGGCVVFLCEPDARAAVVSTLEKNGATVLPVEVACHGVTVKVTK
jgi:D-glycero-alpha-D-manno-heptose-7-phosphate kinase